MPSDLWRFLPLAVFLTCLAEMVLLPTRFFFASAISILLSKKLEDTGGMDAWACSCCLWQTPISHTASAVLESNSTDVGREQALARVGYGESN